MPPKLPPPPPRPDPVTLDQIYTTLTTPGLPLDEKAYHLVALSTVAFHPSVKLFLFELPDLSTDAAESAAKKITEGEAAAAAAAAAVVERDAANQLRRESLLKNVAFFLAQRNNAVCEECRWETVALLGELCRMESAAGSHAQQAQLEAKLNGYAQRNLEFLAQLPWFVPAVHALLAASGKASAETTASTATAAAVSTSASSSSTASTAKTSGMGEGSEAQQGRDGTGAASATQKLSRGELKQKLRETQQKLREGGTPATSTEALPEPDEDVVVALQDILHALPRVEREAADVGGGGGSSKPTSRCVWTSEALAQAHDLMFLDASTNLLHLIPAVSRCYSTVCAMCRKVNNNSSSSAVDKRDAARKFLRCSSCKAVYYCSPECQKQHWTLSHRQPCKNFKERCDTILEEYYKLNSGGGKHGKRGKAGRSAAEEEAAVAVLEVPLEPSLLYETRRYLFDHKDSSFGNVNFYDYFMKYNVRGS